MVTIDSSFIGSFKLGDNICFNLGILKSLYELRANAKTLQKVHLRKPITILNVSIIEAVLYDFDLRVRTFTSEGVVNLSRSVADYIRGKKIDELERYIASARKHDLFDQGESGFYDDLDDLRKLRNRVHIQNTKKHFEADEAAAFSERRLILSEQALECLLLTMSRKYPRRHKFVSDFVLPWQPHFPQ